MPALRRRIAAAGLFVLCATHLGCASGATQRTESERTVQGQPPKEEPPDRMPEGPPVKVDDGGSQDAKSDAEEPREPVKRAVEEGERTYVGEKRVETLLEHGPQYLFQVVSVEPVREGGSFRGYRIVDAANAAMEIMKSKLRVGDVVTKVNGVPIEKPDDYLAAWKKLKHRAVLEVEYRRDGESDRALWYVRERVKAKRGGDRSGDRGR